MSRLLLGVSGGIAAYKALELVRLATKAGHAVRVVQTPSSQRFVGTTSFAALTGAPVLVSEFERDPARGVFPDQTPPDHEPASHLALVDSADVFVVAPASANTLAKLAAGIADNLLTSAALASRLPLVLAPAMNNHMWEHPATQANLALLVERGAVVVEPGVGALATKGEWGVGRLAEPAEILTAALAAAGTGGEVPAPSPTPVPGPLAGRRVLVTAGGTREPIDAVRYVGNRSSGRMGFAIAEAAAALGADVTVIAANVSLPRSAAIEYREAGSATELLDACLDCFPDCELLVMSAAVADFAPSGPFAGKIKKDGREGLTLELEPTTDVLATLSARRRPGQVLVGFAAEHGEDAVKYGRGKLVSKGLDAVVVNDVSDPRIGFDSLENEVTIVTSSDCVVVPRAPKEDVARAILATVSELDGLG